MDDYISRDAAMAMPLANGQYDHEHANEDFILGLESYKEWLEYVPAADVRPVVTCGKCKYGKYTGTEWFCDKHSGHADKFGEDASYYEYHSKHWFCADGEMRHHEP